VRPKDLSKVAKMLVVTFWALGNHYIRLLMSKEPNRTPFSKLLLVNLRLVAKPYGKYKPPITTLAVTTIAIIHNASTTVLR